MLGPSCSEGASRKTDWKLDIPDLDNVPPYSPPIPPLNVKNFSKILHLSDLHVQKNYTIGNVLKNFYLLGQTPQYLLPLACKLQSLSLFRITCSLQQSDLLYDSTQHY